LKCYWRRRVPLAESSPEGRKKNQGSDGHKERYSQTVWEKENRSFVYDHRKAGPRGGQAALPRKKI